jgi:predicted nucleic acid-binding protein
MARLLDSNILIYAVQPEHAFLDEWLEAPGTTISAISITEVLGYEGITPDDERLFEAMFGQLLVEPASERILRRAAGLRRGRRMKLGDAIIAATALEAGSELVTRNEQDFRSIEGLRLVNPFAGRPGVA